MAELNDLHRAILRFESSRRTFGESKAAAIKAEFRMSEKSYYAMRSWIIDQPEAMALYPALVRRLRSDQQRRRSARSGQGSSVLCPPSV